MNKIKSLFNSQLAHDAKVVVQTLMFLVFSIFIALGVCYATNYEIKIDPRVTVVSPISK